VCKSVPVFAGNAGNDPSGMAIRAFYGPGWDRENNPHMLPG